LIKKKKAMKNLLWVVLALLFFLFAACTKNVSIEEKNKDAVRNWFDECWNKHNLNAYERYFALEFVTAIGQNYDEFKQFITTVLSAFPDIQYTIDVVRAEGDKVATRWTVRATHRGEFMGIAATGKQVTMTGINISRHKNGKYVKDWGNWDLFGLIEQLKTETPMK